MKSTLLAISFTLLAVGGASAQTIVYSENFNSYSTGNLTGQGDWSNSPAFFSSVATVANGTGFNTTPAAARGAGVSAAGAFAPVTLGLSSYTSGTFQMDVMRQSGAIINMAGFGNATTPNLGFAFGLGGNTFNFRQGVAGGTSFTLYSAPSTAIQATDGSWYRLTADISFAGSNSTITSVTVQNLTTAGSPFTAYFNSAANQTTLALASDETTWNRVYVRTSASTEGLGYVDNLQFTAVPEPTTWALLAISLTAMTVLRRRRGS